MPKWLVDENVSFCGSRGADQKLEVNTEANNAHNIRSSTYGSSISTSVGYDGFNSSASIMLGFLATFLAGYLVGSNKSRLFKQHQGKTQQSSLLKKLSSPAWFTFMIYFVYGTTVQARAKQFLLKLWDENVREKKQMCEGQKEKR